MNDMMICLFIYLYIIDIFLVSPNFKLFYCHSHSIFLVSHYFFCFIFSTPHNTFFYLFFFFSCRWIGPLLFILSKMTCQKTFIRQVIIIYIICLSYIYYISSNTISSIIFTLHIMYYCIVFQMQSFI